MKAVLQRVTRADCVVNGADCVVNGADCVVNGKVTGEIGPGLLVLLGVGPADTVAVATALAARIVKMRVFSDEAGRMNRSLIDLGGAVLSISQFTLYADTRRGNRPGFTGAAPPELGRALYAAFNMALRALGVRVEEGVFGADMQLTLTNDGPVTIVLDTDAP